MRAMPTIAQDSGRKVFATISSSTSTATSMQVPQCNADLTRVLQLVQHVVPGLRGEQYGGAVWLSDGEQASVLSETLSSHWQQAHLEAGPHYAALRCWGLAIWQPIYLCVIAAHLDGAVPRLAGLTQPVVDGFPQGFRLPVHVPFRGNLDERMQHATSELREFCRIMRDALIPRVGLHRSAADKLQAECVLGALLLVSRHQGHAAVMSNADLVNVGRTWLTQLNIVGGCEFFSYRVRDGTSRLALDRQVCCHHFRRQDGEKCSTCPKLSLDTRIARLQADLP